MKVIVGLGNPGEAYARTRHNIGYLVVDLFAGAEGFPPPRRKFLVRYAEKKIAGESVYLLEPETFMNRSGPAVREFLDYFGGSEVKEALEQSVLVVHDDLDLEEGRLRFRQGGTSGGHRGVQSIIDALGRPDFGRLKVGIGRRPGSDAADYVLERLSRSDEEGLQAAARTAAETLPVWIREGSQACANRFNSRATDGKAPGGAAESPMKDRQNRN